MKPISLETLGRRVAVKRAEIGQGVRAASAAIGISPATLSRVENGRLPDLETFKRICDWLEVDPGEVLGSLVGSTVDKGVEQPAFGVHFRKPDAVEPETAKALAELILAASRAAGFQNPSTESDD